MSNVFHTDEIAKWSVARPAFPTSNSQDAVRDIADALHVAPATIDSEYLNRVTRAASYLGNPSSAAESARQAASFVQPLAAPFFGDYGFPWGSILAPWYNGQNSSDTNSYGVIRNGAMEARNNVFDVVNRVNAFIARAQNAGFAPPNNPFTIIANLNAGRAGLTAINIDSTLSSQIITDIGLYIDLLKAENEGKIDLNKNVNHAAQLSSPHTSFDGLGGSGDPAVDLMQFLPDLDLLKEQKALRTLQALDFSKRVPKIIFTANYAPEGIVKGGIVGWQKIPDASGYIVKRKNIFDNKEVAYIISNDELKVRWEHIKDYVKAWILTFYDNVDQNNVMAFLDGGVEPNAYYTYKIQAYQTRKENKGTIFNVATTPFKTIDPRNIREQFAQIEGEGSESISPYPVLAQLILGNAQYDWVLAGVNVRASIARGDSRTDTRRYSYVTAQLPFLLDQMEREKLVFPKNVSDIVQNVTDSISQFGVMQTIQEVVQETGVMYYFEGKDPKENVYFTKVDVIDEDGSGFLSSVVAAVDPETATMDLRTLATNLPKLLAGGTVSPKDTLDRANRSIKHTEPSEIEIPQEANQPNGQNSEDEVQFLRKLDNIDKEQVDLTTFDGISKFIRTIRIFSDIGPHRGAPVTAQPVIRKPDPIPEPIPPPPPEPVITPSNVVTAQVYQPQQQAVANRVERSSATMRLNRIIRSQGSEREDLIW